MVEKLINPKKIEIWKRIIFMLMFAFLESMVKLLLWLVIFLQTAVVFFTGETNPNLQEFGRSLSVYEYQIWLFLTFNTEELPFPFTPWNNAKNIDLQ